jgi:hypothetical protein
MPVDIATLNSVVFFNGTPEWEVDANYKPFPLSAFAREVPYSLPIRVYAFGAVAGTLLIAKTLGGGPDQFQKNFVALSGQVVYADITSLDLQGSLGNCFYLQYTADSVNYRSELLRATADTDFYKIVSTNKNKWLNLPANTPVTTTYRAEFWEQRFPQEIENIEVVPGKFVRLRNEQRSQRRLYTDFYPAWNHQHMKLLFSQDTLLIGSLTVTGDEYIMEESYEFTNVTKYGLSRGDIWLTLQPTITRNVI